jgi:uncharacterized protein YjiS (DUF1127 family)
MKSIIAICYRKNVIMTKCIDTNVGNTHFTKTLVKFSARPKQYIAAFCRAWREQSGGAPVRGVAAAMRMVMRDIGGYLVKAAEWLSAAHDRRVQRRKLMTLDDRMLSDIGISRADAEAEYRKPFWR